MVAQRKQRVFISYSRKETDFARRLKEAFVRNPFDVWLDLESIPGGEQWAHEIQDGILKADCVIFLYSPNSLTSEWCNAEINLARTQNKRIIPLFLHQPGTLDRAALIASIAQEPWEVTARSNWEAIDTLQGLPFYEGTDFYEAFKKLLNSLEQDIAYVRMHTDLYLRAETWQKHQHKVGYLLHGDELTEALCWQRGAGGKLPPLHELQRTFLRESKTEERKRRHQARWLGREIALKQQLAEEERQKAESERQNRVLAERLAAQEQQTRQMLQRLILRFAGTAVGFGLGMAATIFVSAGAGTDMLTRLRSALALGTQYGLLMALGVVLAMEWLRQPGENRKLQAMIAGMVGFALVFALFRLTRGQTIPGWGWLPISGLVFSGGLALAHTQPSLVVKSIALIFTAFAAFYLPWLVDSPQYPLFLFARDASLDALLLCALAAACVGILVFLPEIVSLVRAEQRGQE